MLCLRVQMRRDVYVSLMESMVESESKESTSNVNEVVMNTSSSMSCSVTRIFGSYGRTMHPKNLYSVEKPDFDELARLYPGLKEYVVQGMIDFSNQDACRELVKAQLQHDFGITWDVPRPYLIPPLANRLNYLCWIDDILHLWSHRGNMQSMLPCKRTILDIGCGANLIYPLLGAAYFGWSFIGCDINFHALHIAAQNRERNPEIAPLIHLRLVSGQSCQQFEETSPGIIQACLRQNDGTFDACVCNPPFFSSEEDSKRNPQTDFAGTSVEMVYPGGEEAFVHNMIFDSSRNKNRIGWFSTMVGKKSTMKMARQLLYSVGAVVIRTTELVQGKTLRWAIAWSFLAPQEINNKPLIRKPYIE